LPALHPALDHAVTDLGPPNCMITLAAAASSPGPVRASSRRTGVAPAVIRLMPRTISLRVAALNRRAAATLRGVERCG